MKKLPKAPLQEVIFEVRWELAVHPQSQQEYDSRFEFAQGTLEQLLKKDFPVYKRKVPQEIPVQMLLYQAIHQFWSESNSWPVVQFGPGIFTVNDTDKNYEWESKFYPLVTKALTWLFDVYEQSLKVNFCSLQYIDAIKINDYSKSDNLHELIGDLLKIAVGNQFDTRGKTKHISVNQSFELEDDSNLNIVVTDGKDKKSQEPILMWQTGVYKKQLMDLGQIINWGNNAHNIISPLFYEMTKGKLYDSFTGNSNS